MLSETRTPASAPSLRSRGLSRIRKNRSVPFFLLMIPGLALAQTPAEQEEDEAVGESINYVFATDLGSGIYDLDGRTLQIYRFTWRKDLREPQESAPGVRFELPMTFGFFDFSPIDVVSSGPP